MIWLCCFIKKFHDIASKGSSAKHHSGNHFNSFYSRQSQGHEGAQTPRPWACGDETRVNMDDFVSLLSQFLEDCVEHFGPWSALAAKLLPNLLFAVQLFSLAPCWRAGDSNQGPERLENLILRRRQRFCIAQVKRSGDMMRWNLASITEVSALGLANFVILLSLNICPHS